VTDEPQPLRPKGLLFLCVANSARSQMAEGIGRALAPAGVKVWSAGSRPTSVRPEAITVLREIGIDISSHRSKALSEVRPPRSTPWSPVRRGGVPALPGQSHAPARVCRIPLR
jgi:hypothetical protein